MLRDAEKIATIALANWFQSSDCFAEVLATPFLEVWQTETAADDATPGRRRALGIGDAATAWVLRKRNKAPGSTHRLSC